jgi:hypothetical protein
MMLTKEDEKAYFREKLRPYVTEVMEMFKEEEIAYSRMQRRKRLYDAYKNEEI